MNERAPHAALRTDLHVREEVVLEKKKKKKERRKKENRRQNRQVRAVIIDPITYCVGQCSSPIPSLLAVLVVSRIFRTRRVITRYQLSDTARLKHRNSTTRVRRDFVSRTFARQSDFISVEILTVVESVLYQLSEEQVKNTS